MSQYVTEGRAAAPTRIPAYHQLKGVMAARGFPACWDGLSLTGATFQPRGLRIAKLGPT